MYMLYQKIVAYKNATDRPFFCIMADGEKRAVSCKNVSGDFVISNCVGAAWDVLKEHTDSTLTEYVEFLINTALAFLREHNGKVTKEDANVFDEIIGELQYLAGKARAQREAVKE